MTEYHFNGELAQKYGVNEAVFLHALAFWVAKNQANGKHLHDGRTWTYNTRAAWVKLFPFWTAKQIRRITDHLVEEKAVLTGNFSEDKADRTLWYALADPILEVYSLLAPTICPNGQMHLPERAQPIAQTGNCNKETVTNQLYIPPTPQGGNESDVLDMLFERFWKAYPPRNGKRCGKAQAYKAWAKLKPDLPTCRLMAAALESDKQSDEWQRENGRYIPMASTWLNGRRWEDEPVEPEQPADKTATARQPKRWHREVINGEEVLVPDEW